MIKNVIFDMDGTILNTLDDLYSSVNYMLMQCGYSPVSFEEVRSFVGNGVGLLVRRALKRDVDEEEFRRCMEVFTPYYDEHKEDTTAPYDGIIELMKALKARGIVMAVVSNKYDAAVKELTAKLFGDYISVAIGESGSVRPKPEPDGVKLAMRELGAHDYDTVYIGDSDVDFRTAANSGLPFIGVTWGFRTEELLRGLGTMYIARSPMEIDALLSVRRFGLLGHNLTHTMSPLIHRELFRLKGIEAEYTVFDVEDLDAFRPIADGLNVTIPHKIAYMDKLDHIDEFALSLGAINCVDDRKQGFNTDFYGFITSFKEFYPRDNGQILVLGYGGVGKVVVKALSGYDTVIAVRDAADKCEAIYKECGKETVDISSLGDSDMRYDAIVNCTPVGMYPHEDRSPVCESVVRRAEYVYDLVYNPIKTELLKIAERYGIPGKSGADMLVYQAVKAHEIWYGAKFDRVEIDAVIDKVTAELNQHSHR